MIKFRLKWFSSPKRKVLFIGGILCGLLVGCSSEAIVESEEATKVMHQTFSKTLSYEAVHYSNATRNGGLDIEVSISVFAPEIDNEKVSLQIVKTGDVSATFSLTGAKQFSQIFDEYGTYDLKLYLEKEITSEEGILIQRDTLIKEKAIDIRFLDDFSDYSTSSDWSIFPFNSSFIGVDNSDLDSESSTQKSFSDFDVDKAIKIDITYRVNHENLPKGTSLDNENKLGLVVNDQNFYLKSDANNEQKVRTINLSNHGGDFDLKWVKFKSMVETPWKIISATSSTTVVSSTLYQLSEAMDILVGYPNFSYVDSAQPEAMYFNFYYGDSATAGFTFGLTSDGIELDGSPFKLTRGPGDYFFKIKKENDIPLRYESTYGVMKESNPYQFNVYIESIELSVP